MDVSVFDMLSLRRIPRAEGIARKVLRNTRSRGFDMSLLRCLMICRLKDTVLMLSRCDMKAVADVFSRFKCVQNIVHTYNHVSTPSSSRLCDLQIHLLSSTWSLHFSAMYLADSYALLSAAIGSSSPRNVAAYSKLVI
jgi:hypothetical protein